MSGKNDVRIEITTTFSSGDFQIEVDPSGELTITSEVTEATVLVEPKELEEFLLLMELAAEKARQCIEEQKENKQ